MQNNNGNKPNNGCYVIIIINVIAASSMLLEALFVNGNMYANTVVRQQPGNCPNTVNNLESFQVEPAIHAAQQSSVHST